MDNIAELSNAFQTAYIDAMYSCNPEYRPEFISNDYKQGKKVLVSIEQELKNCDEFCISVAFIKNSGITPLLMTLKELEKKGIPGKILTTDYQVFTEPKALETLASLKNITLKMYHTSSVIGGFHTKGYIFRDSDIYRIIIGSSNMTLSAITKNREWNTKIVSTESGQVAQDILLEFNELWNSQNSLIYSEFIEDYRREYLKNQIIKSQQRQALSEQTVEFEKYTLKPNKMQIDFINNLLNMREQGVDKALLLSSTGTGKTYASAFAMRELGFKKVLFLVHRNQIAKQALKSYKKVFGNSVSMGMVSGALNRMDIDADYIFATIQTMSKDENLFKFDSKSFDAIIYDEAHHASAPSYKKIIEYFKPEFMLGMTATPDKRDDNIEGRNIYEIFDYNIAYEIRLQQAMEEDLLCPFHYFGITDLEMIDDAISGSDRMVTREEKVENFRRLTSDARADYVVEQAKYYGYSGDRVKGLIFCNRIDEAKELSKKFNERGLRTIALSGADSEEVRSNAVERLVMDEADATDELQPLDYILSIDIFSEGTDIIEVNQIIMLRPTQSPIVFIQQLGRGLRKAENKEYVVVLDFIGNYKNNFMIPIALSGDRSYNKDTVRRYLVEGGRIIPGSSTIHFDEISRRHIFSAIDNANFSDIKLIKENYYNLKDKLGRIPKLCDFDNYGEMDVLRIFDNKSLGSYYKFLVKYEPAYKVRLTQEQEQIIEFVSKKFANGKRVHELAFLDRMLKYKNGLAGLFVENMHDVYGIEIDKIQMKSIINIFTNEFQKGTGAEKTYAKCVFIEKDSKEPQNAISVLTEGNEYRASNDFSAMLEDTEFYNILKELIEFGISRYKHNYSKGYRDTDLVLYQKYTYEDVCRLLGWEKNLTSVMNGYMLDERTGTYPVFINYDKNNKISATTMYEDRFVSREKLIAISKSKRKIDSGDVQNFLHAKEKGYKVQLFVRKNKNDKMSKEFYYLGSMEATGRTQEFTMPNTNATAVEIEWKLDTPVREDIYEYIVDA